MPDFSKSWCLTLTHQHCYSRSASKLSFLSSQLLQMKYNKADLLWVWYEGGQYFYNLSFRLLYLPVELLSYGFLYPVFVILSSNCRLMVKSFCILSRFYLGGPTSVRGFGMYSIGPQSEGKVHCDIDNRHHQVFCHKCLNTWERAVCKLWAVFLSRGLR